MGIRALIGADAPADILAGSDLQNAVALIGLEQDSETKPENSTHVSKPGRTNRAIA